MPTDRITFRLGSLAKPLAAAARKAGRTVSEEIRQRLAKSLNVKPPTMEVGNPDFKKDADLTSGPRVREQNKG